VGKFRSRLVEYQHCYFTAPASRYRYSTIIEFIFLNVYPASHHREEKSISMQLPSKELSVPPRAATSRAHRFEVIIANLERAMVISQCRRIIRHTVVRGKQRWPEIWAVNFIRGSVCLVVCSVSILALNSLAYQLVMPHMRNTQCNVEK
jgi:hypothetical protein